jgi:hypothetical protein
MAHLSQSQSEKPRSKALNSNDITAYLLWSERQKCGTAEIGRPERSERETLPAVATTVLLGFFIRLRGAS